MDEAGPSNDDRQLPPPFQPHGGAVVVVAKSPSTGQVLNLRRANLGALVALIVQFTLGIAVNLYASSEDQSPGGGILTAIGRAISRGPVFLSLHVVVGLLLIGSAISLVIRAGIAHHRFTSVTSTIGLVAILGAAIAGAAFADRGRSGASMAMTIAGAIAVLCYAMNLFVLASPWDDRHIHDGS